MKHDERLDHFPLFFIRYPDDGDVPNVRVPVKQILHLCRENRISLALDHVLSSVADDRIPFSIHTRDIPGIKPGVSNGRSGLQTPVQVAFHDLWAFDHQFAGISVRHLGLLFG